MVRPVQHVRAAQPAVARGANGRTTQATWLVAALSASSGEDLRGRFATEYGFPIDDGRWAEMRSAAQARIDARPWQEPAFGDVDCDHDVGLDDFSIFAECMTGPGTAYPDGCNYADLGIDGDVDLADLREFQRAVGAH